MESPANESSFDLLKSQRNTRSIDLYAAQCGACFKWRLIANVEEYELIRSKLLEEPFICSKKPNLCCNDVADIEQDDTRIWMVDRPSIPQTPPGFQRLLVLRNDLSYKLDAHYVTPTGKIVNSELEVSMYLEENPDIKGVSVADFCFVVPELAKVTVPKDDRKSMASPQARL